MGGLLIKAEYSEKGTLIIKGLLGNLVSTALEEPHPCEYVFQLDGMLKKRCAQTLHIRAGNSIRALRQSLLSTILFAWNTFCSAEHSRHRGIQDSPN